ncbi:MAG: carbonic anhydrase [Actinobacteria bacterium]|nr:MAG: carbonic anhydrase [Actinomycetota bacterium]TMK65047.1 MAG: carbonic anhydrase [Actinomycetota bacterium]
MSIMDRFRKKNEKYAKDFDKGDTPMPPAQRFVVLTCMDARLQPEAFLGMEIGDGHVIRNAGGRASDDALRSLIISSRLLGTQEYAVIHHTDCGMLTFSNDDLRGKLAADTGKDASHMDFLPFSDVDDSVREDVRRIRDNPFIPLDVDVSGWVYDVKTGKLREVVPAGR